MAAAATGLAAALVLVVAGFLSLTSLVAVAGVIGFVAALAASGNPRLVCLLALVLTAPLSLSKSFLLHPHMGGASAIQLDLSDLFIVVLAAFQIRDRGAGYAPAFRFPATAGWWLALTMLGLVAVRHPVFGILATEQMVEMAKELALFLVVVNELRRARQFRNVVLFLAAATIVESLVGFAEYFRHGSLGLDRLGEATDATFRYAAQATYLDDASGTFRVGGLLGHPNLLSGYLALVLPVLIALMLTRVGTRSRLFLGAATACGLGALVLTLSRTGWAAFTIAFLALIVATIFHPRIRRRFVLLRAAMIGGLVVGGIALAPQIIRRLTGSDPGALNFRYEWMDVAWQMVQGHPLLGIGLNTFIFNLPGATRYGDVAGLNERFGAIWPVVHNIYLIIWSEQGTIGFVLFVGVYLSLFAACFASGRRLLDERLYLLNIGCGAGLLASAIDGFGSFFLRNPPCARVFWIVAGIVVALRHWQADHLARDAAAARPSPAAER